MTTPLQSQIETNASGPKKAEGEDVTVEQHSLRDQIAADRYIAGQTAAKKKHRGLRFSRIAAPAARDIA